MLETMKTDVERKKRTSASKGGPKQALITEYVARGPKPKSKRSEKKRSDGSAKRVQESAKAKQAKKADCPNAGKNAESSERDWASIDRYAKNEEPLFLNTVCKIINELPSPYPTKKMGRNPHPPRSMAICYFYMQQFGLRCRKMSSRLRHDEKLREAMGFAKPPSKTSIN